MTKTKVAPFYLGHGVFVLYIIKKLQAIYLVLCKR